MRKTFRGNRAIVATAAAACLILSGAQTGASASQATKSARVSQIANGGTATFAVGSLGVPDYIFPLYPPADNTPANEDDLQFLLYKPLYYYGSGQKTTVDLRLSLATMPVWSANGKTVTIRLKHFTWSDGEPVTASDIQFWQNLVTAESAVYADTGAAGYPSDVLSTSVTSPTTIQFHLKEAYSHSWFLYNSLSLVTPLPEAWDVTSLGAKPGSGGCTTSITKCKAVYSFLESQATKGVSTYASSPIWSVVDGPWKLQSLNTSGEAVFVPNRSYAGVDKPHLSKFIDLPFTSDTAEFNSLIAGNSVDIGYIPSQDSGQKARLVSQGYTVAPWVIYGFGAFVVNFNNPSAGPIFRQTYIRQVLEELLAQNEDIKALYSGFAVENCGPIPVLPPSDLLSSYEKSCPFSFNVARAIKTLKNHGWRVVPDGVTTCANPGNSATECGSGISKGAKLEFHETYATGTQSTVSLVSNYASTVTQAGIKLQLQGVPFGEVISDAVACKPTQAACSWQILDWGGGASYAPNYYPSGETIFKTGAGSNVINYSNPTMDKLLAAATLKGNDIANMQAYENFAVSQVPVIWQPYPDEEAAVNAKLRGFVFNVYQFINPSDWYFSK